MDKPNKTAPTTVSVQEFIATVPSQKRQAEAQILLDIFERASGQPAVMWGPSIIGFGSVHYRYATGREGDTATVGFSPRKAKLSLYLARNFPEFPDLIERLGKHDLAVGCLYVNKLADIDLTVLEELVVRAYEVGQIDYDALAEKD